MDAASIEKVFAHIYGGGTWTGSTTDYMVAILLRPYMTGEGLNSSSPEVVSALTRARQRGGWFNKIQAGFGKLLVEAGVGVKDWSQFYHAPYWDHKAVYSWTGTMEGPAGALPLRRSLFAPVQMLFRPDVYRCCDLANFCRVKSPDSVSLNDTHPACVVPDWRATGANDCCPKSVVHWGAARTRSAFNFPLDPNKPAFHEMSPCKTLPADGVLSGAEALSYFASTWGSGADGNGPSSPTTAPVTARRLAEHHAMHGGKGIEQATYNTDMSNCTPGFAAEDLCRRSSSSRTICTSSHLSIVRSTTYWWACSRGTDTARHA